MSFPIGVLLFASSRAEGEYAIGFYTTQSIPGGKHFLIGDSEDFPIEGLGWMEGVVDSSGIWRWDGLGDFSDIFAGTVMRLDVWHGDQSDVDRLIASGDLED